MKISEVTRCDNCGGHFPKEYYVAIPNQNRITAMTRHTGYHMAKMFSRGLIITVTSKDRTLDNIYDWRERKIPDLDVDVAICDRCTVLAKAPIMQIISTIKFNRGY